MNNEKVLCLYDFDGTITKKDSFLAFIKFSVGRVKYFWGIFLLSPILVCYVLKLVSNEKAKQIVISYFFRNKNYGTFKMDGEEFCKQIVPSLVKDSAVKKIESHVKKGFDVYIVTASIKEWVAPWAESMGMKIIATEIECKDYKLTGKLATPNCYGEEKVNRIKEMIHINEYDIIYAYGDTVGDKQMLALATKSYFQYFD